VSTNRVINRALRSYKHLEHLVIQIEIHPDNTLRC